MKTFLAFVFMVLALVSSILLSTQFGIYQKFPIVHYVLALMALAFMMWVIIREYSHFKLATNIVGWFLFGAFLWFTLSYSSYGGQKTIVPGTAPGLTELILRDAGGNPFPMAEALASQKMTLLVFYRGYW